MRESVILHLGLLAGVAWVLGVSAQDMTLYEGKPFAKRDNPCAPVCNDYKNICLPKWVDPHNRFPSHCVDDTDLNRASDRCVLCLKLNGVPQGSNDVSPADGDTCCDCDDPCGCVCLDYDGMCMPEKVDPEGVHGARCQEHDERYPPPKCMFCLLKHGLPDSLDNLVTAAQVLTTVTETATSMSTTTPTTTAPTVDDNSDFCAPVCGHYKDICLPQWVDPKNVFRPHCEGNANVLRAPVRCVLCLKLNGVPSPPDVDLSRSSCCDCVDPCGCVCDYEDMCMPSELDTARRFQPQCSDVENYGHPTPWCVYCLKTRGLPASLVGVGHATIATVGTQRTATRSTTTLAADITSNNSRSTKRNSGNKYIQTTRRPTHSLETTSSRRTTRNPNKMDSGRSTENPKKISSERTTKGVSHEITAEKLAPKGVTEHPKKTAPERTTEKMVPESARNHPKKTTPARTKTNQKAKQSTTTNSMGTPKAETGGGRRHDACRQVCKGYLNICLPSWLDPWQVFTPHCEDVLYVGMPDIACLLCLKSHGVTPIRPRQSLDVMLTPDTTQPAT